MNARAGTWKALPWSASREAVNALLRRAQRFHVSVNGVAEYDVTALRERLRQERRAGREIGLASYLVKATAQLIAEQRHLNRHHFTGLFGRRRVVELAHIDCTLVVGRRGPERDEILLPALLRDADTLALDDIEREVRRLKSTPLRELSLWQGRERLERLPRLAHDVVSALARSSPDFYLQHFGSYGLSSLVRVGGHGVGGATLANTGVAFLPGSIRRLPRYVGDDVVAREILTFGIVFDHLLFDGIQMVRATERLGDLLERPELVLGPPSPDSPIKDKATSPPPPTAESP